MAEKGVFGWDLLYKLNEPIIRNASDVLICLVHWTIVHTGFHCVGIGEDTTLPNQDEYSESLPNGWNCSNNKYNLRYVHDGKLYIFSAVSMNNNLVINMNRLVDNRATGTCLSIEDIKGLHGTLSTIIPNHNTIILKIEQELISPMLCSVPSRTVETQTNTEIYSANSPRQLEPSRSEHSVVPVYIPYPPRPLIGEPQRQPLRDIGRNDLDPFAQPGGGMILPTPGFGGPPLPAPPGLESGVIPGSVPAGARFDPFAPPGREPRPEPQRTPDQDHLPPPGYDDMFT